MKKGGAVIIGGGAVGMSLALLLECVYAQQSANHLPPILMMQSQPLDDSRATRWLSLNQASMELLHGLHVRPELTPFAAMQVFDLVAGASFTYNAQDFGVTALGYTIDEHRLLHALQQRLDVSQLVRVGPFVNIESDGGQWLCHSADGEVCSAPLVFAADGSSSQLLQHIQPASRRVWESGDVAVVVNLVSDVPYVPVARQWFSSQGVVALLPDNAHGYSLVWSAKEARADELMQLDDSAFADAVMQATAGQAGKLKLTNQRAAFPLRSHVANTLTSNGLALVGNSACTIHPLAGQGLNLSLWGIAKLVDCIAEHGFSEKMLYNWQARVLPVNYAYWLLMHRLRWVFHSTNAALVLFRSGLIHHVFSQRLPSSLAVDFAMHGVKV